MDLSASVLGRSVVAYLTDRQRAAILTIGKDRFDRATLAGVACFNFTAAANLSKLLNAELKVKDTREVFDRVHPDQLAIRGLGAVSLAVLGAAFEARGIGGDTPLANWFTKHRDGGIVTFASLKRHETAAASAAGPSKARRARKVG